MPAWRPRSGPPLRRPLLPGQRSVVDDPAEPVGPHCGATTWLPMKTLRRFVAWTVSQSSSVISKKSWLMVIPALLTRMSMRPPFS